MYWISTSKRIGAAGAKKPTTSTINKYKIRIWLMSIITPLHLTLAYLFFRYIILFDSWSRSRFNVALCIALHWIGSHWVGDVYIFTSNVDWDGKFENHFRNCMLLPHTNYINIRNGQTSSWRLSVYIEKLEILYFVVPR